MLFLLVLYSSWTYLTSHYIDISPEGKKWPIVAFLESRYDYAICTSLRVDIERLCVGDIYETIDRKCVSFSLNSIEQFIRRYVLWWYSWCWHLIEDVETKLSAYSAEKCPSFWNKDHFYVHCCSSSIIIHQCHEENIISWYMVSLVLYEGFSE